MNQLSWLLYSVDVLYSFSGFVLASLIFAWLGYAVHTLIAKIWASEVYSWDSEPVKDHKRKWQEKSILPDAKWFLLSLVACLFLVLVPQKETLYLIVASEAGETVIKTPEAQEIMDAVKEIINIQLEKLKQKE